MEVPILQHISLGRDSRCAFLDRAALLFVYKHGNQHWRGVPSTFARNGSPVNGFSQLSDVRSAQRDALAAIL